MVRSNDKTKGPAGVSRPFVRCDMVIAFETKDNIMGDGKNTQEIIRKAQEQVDSNSPVGGTVSVRAGRLDAPSEITVTTRSSIISENSLDKMENVIQNALIDKVQIVEWYIGTQ